MLKCDLCLNSSALCWHFQASRGNPVMWDPQRPTATCRSYLDFMMNPSRDKPIAHAHLWGNSEHKGSAGFRRSSLWNQNNTPETNGLFGLLPIYYRAALLQILAGRSVFLVSALRSMQSSHYSPRDLGGQFYQVEWSYKINWMFCWGKCRRWWTERAPAQSGSPVELPWVLQTGTEARQLDDRLQRKVAIRIKHELTRQGWYVSHPSFSAALRAYLRTSRGAVRYWTGHTWLHRRGIRIADGAEKNTANRCKEKDFGAKPQREGPVFELATTMFDSLQSGL